MKNSNSPFPPELRTASVVPRWSIVWTLTRDTVANHSFFNTFYSYQIGRLIMWEGDYSMLMYRALTHDLEETITGDLPSPVKREILDSDRAAAYIEGRMANRLGTIMLTRHNQTAFDEKWKEADRIIKAADRLDMLIFLLIEQRLGNGVIAPSVPIAWHLMEEAWYNLPADPDKLSLLWTTNVVPAIELHNIKDWGWGL